MRHGLFHASARVAAIVLAAACRRDLSDVPTAATEVTGANAPTSSGRVAKLRVSIDTTVPIAGIVRDLMIDAVDARSAPVSTDRAGVSSSNTSVADVWSSKVVPVRDLRGVTVQSLVPSVRLVAPGSAWLRVELDGVADSVFIAVSASPRNSSSLAVESFSVVEYRATCAWACPYLVYAPLLKLRATAGAAAEVVAVEFTLGHARTGLCRGSVLYTPGLVADVNLIYDYLWANDLIFVSIGGTPLPGEVAVAHVVVREPNGGYSQIDATGAVLRGVTNPTIPMATGGMSGWSCS